MLILQLIEKHVYDKNFAFELEFRNNNFHSTIYLNEYGHAYLKNK